MSEVQIFDKLISCLSFLEVKEIILALETDKVARNMVHPEKLFEYVELMESIGLHCAIHDRKYVCKEDCGKNGWVSSCGIEVSLEDDLGECMVYVSKYPDKALEALRNEHSSDDEGFGRDLGIPQCCIKKYVQNITAAQEKQSDYLSFTAMNTTTGFPYSMWTNICAQYFGYCLISHYPCSFGCQKTSQYAKRVYSIIRRYSGEYADRSLRYHKSSYLYTEYDGIFRFPESIYNDGVLHYNNQKMDCTLNSVLASVLKQGSRIEIIHKHSIRIFDNLGSHLASICHPDLIMLVFDDKL